MMCVSCAHATRRRSPVAGRNSFATVLTGLVDEIAARFRRERRILARLQHPNIARLLDAATTPGEALDMTTWYTKPISIRWPRG